MTLPEEIGDAAQDADRDRVMAWLDAGGSVNDKDSSGFTLVHCCAYGSRESFVIRDQHVALARHLIALGADVNVGTGYQGGFTPLHEIVQKDGDDQAVLDMLSLFLRAGANANAKDSDGETPLYDAIRHGHTTVITELLRAGASLDACNGDESAEDVIQRHESDHSALAGNEDWCAIKRLVAVCAKIKFQAPASRHRRDHYPTVLVGFHTDRRRPPTRELQALRTELPPRRPGRPRPRAARQAVDGRLRPELPRAARRQRRVLAYPIVLARDELR